MVRVIVLVFVVAVLMSTVFVAPAGAEPSPPRADRAAASLAQGTESAPMGLLPVAASAISSRSAP
jgi:hypothetical protein